MIVKSCSSITQLQQVSIFKDLATVQLESLVSYSYICEYQQDEIIMREGMQIPLQLHALVLGKLEIKKTASQIFSKTPNKSKKSNKHYKVALL